MLQKLFQRKNKTETLKSIAVIYNTIVDAARCPVFYRNLSVPDTTDGRFDMIILHMFVILDLLQKEQDDMHVEFSQGLFDYMFADMDRSLRELGVGDLGVPKHMKRMMKGFNGRMEQYHEALKNDDATALTIAIKKNIFFGATDITDPQIIQMCHYTQMQYKHIYGLSISDIYSGTFSFMEPQLK
jgi:cytochrome b pre-mRNA-processing protein 3